MGRLIDYPIAMQLNLVEEAGLQYLSRYGHGTSYSNRSSGPHRIIVTVNQATGMFTKFHQEISREMSCELPCRPSNPSFLGRN